MKYKNTVKELFLELIFHNRTLYAETLPKASAKTSPTSLKAQIMWYLDFIKI